eukprot:TRINITY_DN1674_c0_g1_i4.p1 TRINITY_DN1674_c0_g1~~TRINITY_DN1674_c0_g1_i4.p1  ORF type:complete len:1048 (-),score=151.95 TRINITY_DN1674_c0_g1_i4:39-3182(-)
MHLATTIALLTLVACHVYCADFAVWEELTVAGVPRLAEHCAVAIGDNVIIFGGIRDGTRRNTVYQWTAGSNTMTEMAALPTEPSSRVGHTCVVYNSYMYVFGGQSGSWNSDVWRYDPAGSGVWTEVTIASPTSGIKDHASVVLGDYLYVFGGQADDNSYVQQTRRFHFPTSTWSTPPVLGTEPSARKNHRMDVYGTAIYMFGGFSSPSTHLHDIHRFTEAAGWEELTPSSSGDDPSGMESFSFHFVNDRVAVFGGYGYHGASLSYLNDMYEYDFQLNVWVKPTILGDAPSVRHNHVAVRVGDWSYIICGSVDLVGYTAKNDIIATNYSRPECPAGQYSAQGDASCTNCAGGYVSTAPGAYNCTACPQGTYTNGVGDSACHDCTRGTYSLTPLASDSSVCIQCNAGYYSTTLAATTASVCQQCSAGSYSVSAGSSVCSQCGAGTASPTAGATTSSVCTSCNKGYYSLSGASACTPCNPGQYGPALGRSFCSTCVAGTYNANYGRSVCTNCPAGRYGTSSGATSLTQCTKCPAGEWQGSTGKTTCTKCIQGTYSTAIGASTISTCVKCSAGKYSTTLGAGSATFCLDCPKGQYQDTSGSTSCDNCPVGTYLDFEGADEVSDCIQCPAGSFGGSTGLTALGDCESCANGHWGISGHSQCIDCVPGTYSTQSQATTSDVCIRCIGNTHSSSGSSTCSACASGTFAFTGFSSCIDCTQASQDVTDGGYVLDAGFDWPEMSDPGDHALERWLSIDDGYVDDGSEIRLTNVGGSSSGAKQVITLTANNPIPLLFAASSKTSGGVAPASPDKSDNYAAILTLKYSDSSEAVASTLQFSRSATSYVREYDVITLNSAPVQATISLVFTGHTSGSVWFDDITLTPNPEHSCNCSSGFYYHLTVSGPCKYCEQGSECRGGARYPCGEGMYTFGGATACSSCPSGWICLDGIPYTCGKSEYNIDGSCTPCPLGAACRDGRIQYCHAGSYGLGGRECLPCFPGTYTDRGNMTSCLTCGNGTTSTYLRDGCYSCPAGECMSKTNYNFFPDRFSLHVHLTIK